MKIKGFLICFLAISVSLPIQGKRLDAGQQSTQVIVRIDSLIATPNGIKAHLTGQNTRDLSFSIEKKDKGTGNFVPWIKGVTLSAPPNLGNSYLLSDDISIPVLVAADPTEEYRLYVFGSATIDEKAAWVTDNMPSPIMRGYSPNITDTIKLEFTSDELIISALTSNIAKLTAIWCIPGPAENTPIGVQATETDRNPNLGLPFAILDQARKKAATQAASAPVSTPAFQISLEDMTTGIKQQALITLSVNVGQQQAKVNAVKGESDPNTPISKKTKFSWGDLLKTGVSAILKYFVI
jgi:hypothetical protein